MNPLNLSYFTNSWVILPLIIWTAFWKGYALWTASKNNHKKWFIALVILNTFGILEIIYVFFVVEVVRRDRILH